MTQYDLLLKGGHVIDPANNIDAPLDVAVRGDRIAQVAPDLPSALAARTVDVAGLVVTPGLIDIHVHVYHTREPETLSIIADHHTFRAGVTTVVDRARRRRDGFRARRVNRARLSRRLRRHQDRTLLGVGALR